VIARNRGGGGGEGRGAMIEYLLSAHLLLQEVKPSFICPGIKRGNFLQDRFQQREQLVVIA
jgi:hypothetical protein